MTTMMITESTWGRLRGTVNTRMGALQTSQARGEEGPLYCWRREYYLRKPTCNSNRGEGGRVNERGWVTGCTFKNESAFSKILHLLSEGMGYEEEGICRGRTTKGWKGGKELSKIRNQHGNSHGGEEERELYSGKKRVMVRGAI